MCNPSFSASASISFAASRIRASTLSPFSNSINSGTYPSSIGCSPFTRTIFQGNSTFSSFICSFKSYNCFSTSFSFLSSFAFTSATACETFSSDFFSSFARPILFPSIAPINNATIPKITKRFCSLDILRILSLIPFIHHPKNFFISIVFPPPKNARVSFPKYALGNIHMLLQKQTMQSVQQTPKQLPCPSLFLL